MLKALVRVTTGIDEDGQSVPHWVQVRVLGASEYEEVRVHRDRLMQFERDTAAYELVRRSYTDYTNCCAEFLDAYRGRRTVPGADHDLVNDLDRLLLIFLNAMRTFLDHAETRLKHRYGESSREFRRFQAATAAEYDAQFAYRFLYHLRNYVQHCGMAIGHVRLGQEPDGDKDSGYFLRVVFDRDKLLFNYGGWKAALRDELSTMPNEFDVAPLVEAMHEAISRVAATMIASELSDLTRSALILKHFTRLVESPAVPCVVDLGSLHKTGGTMEVEELPLQTVETILSVTQSPRSRF